MKYADAVLRHLVSEPDYEPSGWALGSIRAFRTLAQCISAATIPRDVIALRCLGLQPNGADGTDSWLVRLQAERQLRLTFKTDGGESAAEVELDMNGTDEMA